MHRPGSERTLADIEQTQEKLRQTIQQTRELAAETERLIERHRRAHKAKPPLEPS